MGRTTYNFESLERRGVFPSDADEVLASGIWEEIPPSVRGNVGLMFVGFTPGGRLLEVAVDYFKNEDREHIFYADDATAERRIAFEKRMMR